MKNMLLLLALIAAPAWAGDVSVAPSSPKPAPMQAASVAASSVVIELKGAAGNIAALVADLEKEAVYQEAACAPAKKSGKTAKITCAKADSGLMAFLGKYASAKVRWSISGATAVVETTAAAVAAPVTATMQSTLVCKTGCIAMPCPATVKCCSTTTHQPCY